MSDQDRMTRILVLDAGNSRLKWGLASRHGWLGMGSVAKPEVGALNANQWRDLPVPDRIVGANVAGDGVRRKIEAQFARWRVDAEWLVPSREAGGVRNGYADPARLGADRWAALAAARARQLRAAADRNADPQPCLVVGLGTAVTIDALTADGLFPGGLILPGLPLMHSSLADSTDALSFTWPSGRYADFPATTEDAMFSGAVQAVCGAIRGMRRLLAERHAADGASAQTGRPVCFLAGGDTPLLAPHLTEPLTIVDNLVLEGVLALTAPEDYAPIS